MGMNDENRTIELKIDPKKKMAKVDFMNAMANVVQIIHSDPVVDTIRFQIKGAGKFDLKLK